MKGPILRNPKYIILIMCLSIVILFGEVVILDLASAEKTISIAIADSPWLPGFRSLIDLYEQETGNRIKLNVFPFTGLLEKELTAVNAKTSEFDIINLNEGWYSTFYAGGLVSPLTDIDPSFKLDPQVIEYQWATRWDKKKNYSVKDAPVYGVPINGNIQLFYYRTDLYKNGGFSAPTTWEDVIAAAQKLQDPRKGIYGYVNRGQKGGISISYDWFPFLRGFNGDIFADAPNDWTVTINSEAGKSALELYLNLAKFAPPNVGDIGQAEQIALMGSGKVVQTILVAAAFPHMDDPEKSIVPYKIGYTIIPRPSKGRHSTTSGIWLMGIPKNLPKARQSQALEFLKWAVSKKAQMAYAQFGAVPVRQDVFMSELSNEPKFRYMKAMAASTSYIDPIIRIPEGPRIFEVLELRLNQALTKQLSINEALATMEREISGIVREAGYKLKNK
ncbi:MAG: extracellular solute-binding protein [Firmicutes bacterium]|nr:extracellular solute-binding protein [Bacillota bacterium]